MVKIAILDDWQVARMWRDVYGWIVENALAFLDRKPIRVLNAQ